MALSVGTRLGRYEIVALLGAGGMGEVYRARDTRLERDVAIKVLPPDFADDRERVERFEREARAAGRLNHPNITTVYDVGTHEGTTYLVSELLDGETLGAALKRGPLSPRKAVDLCLQIARGLAAAHEEGIVHRDLKPENLFLLRRGRIKILDFGLAKLRRAGTDDAGAPAETATATAPGLVMGTAAYMAPEQVRSLPVDPRADLFALGAIFYEMLAGKRAFAGDSAVETMNAILTEDPDSLAEHVSGLPNALEALVYRCLEKNPEERFQSARDLGHALEALSSPPGSGPGQVTPVSGGDVPPATGTAAPSATPRTSRRGIVAMALVTLASITAVTWWQVRERQARQTRAEALVEIERLADDNRIVEAFLLAEKNTPLASEDPALRKLMNRLSIPVDIHSDPLGAEVSFQDYRTTEDAFHTVGRTPLEAVRVPVPKRVLRWRVEKEGYGTLEAAETSLWGALDFDLTPADEAPPRMHRVPAGSERFQANEPIDVPAFWLDTYEVTNREFQEFVDAGGYDEPRYWTPAMDAAGGELSWEELTARLRDATGRPGPAGWRVGRYPEGTEDHPVGGVSWFEAAAYAEFAGKSLPTAYHWRRAVPWSPFGDMLLLGRFQADGSVPVGSSGAVGRYGHYDLAGNVAEWCWNEASGGKRYLLGGSWAEPSYIFMAHPARSPFERGPDFGIRLASFDAPPPAELSEPVSIEPHDFSQEVPVSDEVFAVYRSLFAYDPIPLDPRVESVDDSSRDWRRETVSFTAAYGGERVLAHLFLPRDAPPPYKTVVYVPGSGARFVSSIEDAWGEEALFVPRSGRALVFPAYKGMLERGGGETRRGELSGRERRDLMIQSVNDLQRTIDYLETREDVDSDSLAYLGLSYGGEYGPVYTAIEQRFVTLVYFAGGFDAFQLPDEIQPWNYAPRVTTPTLMVNGRDDYFSPVEAAQKPMLDLLGVAPEDKRHVILEGGHIPYDMNAVIREILDWLDRYQGTP